MKLENVYYNNNYDWKTHYEHFGWSIINISKNNDEILTNIKNNFIEWIKLNNPKLDYDNPKKQSAYGIFKKNLGHKNFQWELRKLCYKYFCELFGSHELISSYDGGCFLPPIDNTDNKHFWFHLDQPNPNIDQKITIQGFVNLEENKENDGGLVIIKNSNKFYEEYIQNDPTNGYDWNSSKVKLDIVKKIYDEKNVEFVINKICCEFGDLVVWNSRMIHCNISGVGERNRLCLYVSMTPKRDFTDDEILIMKNNFIQRKMTGHICRGPSMITLQSDKIDNFSLTQEQQNDKIIQLLTGSHVKIIENDI